MKMFGPDIFGTAAPDDVIVVALDGGEKLDPFAIGEQSKGANDLLFRSEALGHELSRGKYRRATIAIPVAHLLFDLYRNPFRWFHDGVRVTRPLPVGLV